MEDQDRPVARPPEGMMEGGKIRPEHYVGKSEDDQQASQRAEQGEARYRDAQSEMFGNNNVPSKDAA